MIKVFNNIKLTDRNSFHVNATARRVIEYSSAEDLRTIFSDYNLSEWYPLSGGNNILFTADVEATLLTPRGENITIEREDDDHTYIYIEAGAEWDDVVEWCTKRDLWGAENLSLIPGKAGAAPIQNIGAYGTEVCDIITSVDLFDCTSHELRSLSREECEFGYRDSIFKRRLKGQVIVTGIHLRLSKSPNPQLHYADLISRVAERGEATLRTIRDVICEIREEKLPDTKVLGNAGSFFKNPIVSQEKAEALREIYPNMPLYNIAGDDSQKKLAAGWLIDQAKMKGYREGSVGVHDRQALVLVNHGGATGAEILALSRKVQQRVSELFGVEIESEVNIL